MLIGVNFHYVRPTYDQPYPSFFGITADELDARLQLLAQHGEFVGAADIRAAARGERPLPERSWLVTFDDGLREQFEHAWPVLRGRGIPGLFFVNTGPIAESRVSTVHKIHLLRAEIAPERLARLIEDHARALGIAVPPVADADAARQYKYDTLEAGRVKYLLNIALNPADTERIVNACFADAIREPEAEISRQLYMSPAQIQELARSGCVGTHAHDHLPLGRLSPERVEYEIAESLDWLERWTAERPFALSYPYGGPESCSPVTAAVASRLGIELAFTMERAGNADLRTPLWLARCDNNDLPGGKAARHRADSVFEEIAPARWGTAETVGFGAAR